jgi:hypothetical protein
MDMQPSMMTRRKLLTLTGGALGASLLVPLASAQDQPPAEPDLAAALAATDLIYVTPLHRDGRESTCQAEVWFVAEGTTSYVVTAREAWRARAVANGLTRARVWVGDVGVWRRSNGAYRALPSVATEATFITEPGEHARVLESFGAKYPLSWVVWGRRFRNGLADGSRVMLRYQPV